MRRFLAFLWALLGLLLALAAGAAPARAYPLGQRAPILTPDPCANVTLKMDFAANNGGGLYCLNGQKYPSFLAVPGASFTRASTETCAWADGHLSYAPPGVPCTTDLGIGVWEGRTNLLTWSQTLTNVVWSAGGVMVTDNESAAPDGTTTGAFVREDGSTGTHTVDRTATVGVTAGQIYTYSVIAKAGARSKIVLVLAGSDLKDRAFDLSAGTSATGQVLGTNPSAWAITPLINGWYLVSVTFIAGANTADPRVYLSNGSATSYTGDNASGIYLWGEEMDLGAFVGPYTPTTGAAATRAAVAVGLTYAPVGASISLMYGAGVIAMPSAASPIDIGVSSGGAWVNNTIRKLMVAK
ncbi:MAG: hypothetical protein WDN45_10380 [Caulobacteraceae bacterium]